MPPYVWLIVFHPVLVTLLAFIALSGKQQQLM
jgi:hypothetical protein